MGLAVHVPAAEISPADAAEALARGSVLLLDVREPSELRHASVKGAKHVPMRQVPQHLADLPRDRPILVLCHHGGRSQVVADWLSAQGLDARNVAGGIAAWADDVDATVGRY